MTCAARLHGDPTGLACTGADDHEFGCTFESTSGVPDAHWESSHE
jgi:hypothetical protein